MFCFTTDSGFLSRGDPYTTPHRPCCQCATVLMNWNPSTICSTLEGSPMRISTLPSIQLYWHSFLRTCVDIVPGLSLPVRRKKVDNVIKYREWCGEVMSCYFFVRSSKLHKSKIGTTSTFPSPSRRSDSTTIYCSTWKLQLFSTRAQETASKFFFFFFLILENTDNRRRFHSGGMGLETPHRRPPVTGQNTVGSECSFRRRGGPSTACVEECRRRYGRQR